jgi:hypothetical protein
MCVLFAKVIYPTIPSYLGGAKPVIIQVYIVPNSKINNSFKDCKLNQIDNGVGECTLILATDSEYVFAAKDNKIITKVLCVKKQDVRAIQYSRYFISRDECVRCSW